MKITDDKLVGRVVIAGDGTAIGEITRLFVDTASWRVESLQVALRWVHLGRQRVHVVVENPERLSGGVATMTLDGAALDSNRVGCSSFMTASSATVPIT